MGLLDNQARTRGFKHELPAHLPSLCGRTPQRHPVQSPHAPVQRLSRPLAATTAKLENAVSDSLCGSVAALRGAVGNLGVRGGQGRIVTGPGVRILEERCGSCIWLFSWFLVVRDGK